MIIAIDAVDLLALKVLSAVWRMALKFAALKGVSAIADLTLEGNCFFHKPPINFLQQQPCNWLSHRSFTNALARLLGVSVRTLPIALSK